MTIPTPESSGLAGENLSGRTVEGSPEDQERELLELFEVSAEVEAAERPRLRQIVNSAVDSSINPQRRRALQLTGHVLDWALFGKRGDPIPPGMILLEDGLGYDLSQYFDEICYMRAMYRLEGLGLRPIEKAVVEDIKSRRAERDRMMESLTQTTAEYKLVQSFNMQLPPEHRPQPLSPFFRTLRERQIKEDIRLRYGVEYQEEIEPHSMAGRALAKRLQLLDEETMLRKTTHPEGDEDAVEKAKRFFRQAAINHMVETGYSQAEAARRCETMMHHYCYEAARPLSLELGKAATPLEQWAGREFLSNFVYDLFDTDGPEVDDFDSLVENATYYTISQMHDDYENSLTYDFGTNLQRRLRLPFGGSSITYKQYEQQRLAYDHSHIRETEAIGFTTAAELARDEQTVIGEIEKRQKVEPEFRLLQLQARSDHVPVQGVNEELRIRLTGGQFQSNDPHIPGYTLSGRDGEYFGFVQNTERDPYTKANISIPSEARIALAHEYEKLGLSNLAESVRSNPQLTVEDLRKLIRDNSRYTVPASNNAWLPDKRDMLKLSFFKSLAQDGKLRAQCDGAAKFLQLSLETAFGPGAADVETGYVIGRKKAITAVGHAQTSFVHDGQAYLLDATPYSRNMRWRLSLTNHDTAEPARAATAPPPPLVIEYTEPEIQKTPEEQRKLRIASIRKTLEMQLGVLFGAADQQAVYEKAVQLSAEDPLRRTLETVVLADRDEPVHHREIEALANYLGQYRDTSPELLTQARLPKYDQQTLESLYETVRQVGMLLLPEVSE